MNEPQFEGNANVCLYSKVRSSN